MMDARHYLTHANSTAVERAARFIWLVKTGGDEADWNENIGVYREQARDMLDNPHGYQTVAATMDRSAWAVETQNTWDDSWSIGALCATEGDAKAIAVSESEGEPTRVRRQRTDYTVLEYVGGDEAHAAALRAAVGVE